ncbi:MAG: hypothetical protein WDW36_002220 [Sanguina aurantia]
MGDVYPSAGLKASLQARSYKREIILIAETRMNPVYQAYNEFAKLGLGHVLWLTDSPVNCERSSTRLPQLGCAWSTQPFQITDAQANMHMDRVAYAGRALRLGYNVLLVDADIVMFHDPYKFLKAPPLAHHNLLMMRDGSGYVNCGVVYMQNATPDGPTSWFMNGITDRVLRWEASRELLGSKTPPAPHYCLEQDQYSEMVLSVIAGRPLFFVCWMNQLDRKAWWAAHEKLFTITGSGDNAFGEARYLTEVISPWPKELFTPDIGLPTEYHMHSGVMHVPNAKGVWPAELGGEPYVSPRTGAAAAHIALLLEDHPGLWTAMEDAAHAHTAASTAESFAFLPPFFVQSWSVGGGTGFWNGNLVGPLYPQVMAHFVHTPGGGGNKPVVKMSLGRYDWSLAHMAREEEGVFYASTPEAKSPDILAFSPEIEAFAWPGIAAFQEALQALVLLGMASKRAVAFPSLACNLTWIQQHDLRKLPLDIDHGRYISYGGAGGGHTLRCMSTMYMNWECMEAREAWSGGLLPLEFEHYLTLVESPTLHATYDLEAMSQPVPQAAPGRPTPTKATGNATIIHPIEIDVAALAASISAHKERVIWLGAVPRLQFNPVSQEAHFSPAVRTQFTELVAKRCFAYHQRRMLHDAFSC